jgi:hypothetical protein
MSDLSEAKSLKKYVRKNHPGFKNVQNNIASKEGVSKEAVGAILASATRGASTKAKKANPKLKKVK